MRKELEMSNRATNVARSGLGHYVLRWNIVTVWPMLVIRGNVTRSGVGPRLSIPEGAAWELHLKGLCLDQSS